jgi:PRC-barrel domain protein
LSTRSTDSFEGRELFDSGGYKIGDIETVFIEDGLEYALVKSGLFGTIRRLVPLNDVRESGDELVVPYSKDKVKRAPPAEADKRLSEAARERL